MVDLKKKPVQPPEQDIMPPQSNAAATGADMLCNTADPFQKLLPYSICQQPVLPQYLMSHPEIFKGITECCCNYFKRHEPIAEWTNRRGNDGARHVWKCSICKNALISMARIPQSKLPDKCPCCGVKMKKAADKP